MLLNIWRKWISEKPLQFYQKWIQMYYPMFCSSLIVQNERSSLNYWMTKFVTTSKWSILSMKMKSVAVWQQIILSSTRILLSKKPWLNWFLRLLRMTIFLLFLLLLHLKSFMVPLIWKIWSLPDAITLLKNWSLLLILTYMVRIWLMNVSRIWKIIPKILSRYSTTTIVCLVLSPLLTS